MWRNARVLHLPVPHEGLSYPFLLRPVRLRDDRLPLPAVGAEGATDQDRNGCYPEDPEYPLHGPSLLLVRPGLPGSGR